MKIKCHSYISSGLFWSKSSHRAYCTSRSVTSIHLPAAPPCSSLSPGGADSQQRRRGMLSRFQVKHRHHGSRRSRPPAVHCVPAIFWLHSELPPSALLALQILKISEMKVKRLSGDGSVPHKMKWNLRKVSCSFAEDYCCKAIFFPFFIPSLSNLCNLCKISAASCARSQCVDRMNE